MRPRGGFVVTDRAAVAFLLVRIADDKQLARDLLYAAREVQATLRDPRTLGLLIPGWFLWPEIERQAERAVTDCDAKRDLVNYYGNVRPGAYALKLLAQPYADHPDFPEELKL